MTINAVPGQLINLGEAGEVNATIIHFDLSKWYKEYHTQYPQLYLTLKYSVNNKGVQDYFDKDSLPLSETHQYFEWLISGDVTGEVGPGVCQIFGSVTAPNENDTTEFKTITDMYVTVVTESLLSTPVVTPSYLDTW